TFARDIMELSTMAGGHYTASDIRAPARACPGWSYVDPEMVGNAHEHDAGARTLLGRTGRFVGAAVTAVARERPAPPEYMAAQSYRFFVREEPDAGLRARLGAVPRDADYEIRPLLETIFLSRDFYSPASVGTHIKSPVELAISTYRKRGLDSVPGIPD